MFDGKVPHWHHFSCFWQRASVQSTADVGGFSDLRWADQEAVKKAIESGGVAGTGLCLSELFVHTGNELTFISVVNVSHRKVAFVYFL